MPYKSTFGVHGINHLSSCCLTDCFCCNSAGVAFKQIGCRCRVKAVYRDAERYLFGFRVRCLRSLFGVQYGVKLRPCFRAANAVNRQAIIRLERLQGRKGFPAEVAVSAVFRQGIAQGKQPFLTVARVPLPAGTGAGSCAGASISSNAPFGIA